MRKIFFHSLLSGTLAGLASLGYDYAYCAALMVDFSAVIGISNLMSASILGSVLAGLGYFAVHRRWGRKADGPFNVLFILLTLVSFLGPWMVRLPLDLPDPELFVGLTIPMHIFPLMFWLGLKPWFVDPPESN